MALVGFVFDERIRGRTDRFVRRYIKLETRP
jgi:predicted methyltransferase